MSPLAIPVGAWQRVLLSFRIFKNHAGTYIALGSLAFIAQIVFNAFVMLSIGHVAMSVYPLIVLGSLLVFLVTYLIIRTATYVLTRTITLGRTETSREALTHSWARFGFVFRTSLWAIWYVLWPTLLGGLAIGIGAVLVGVFSPNLFADSSANILGAVGLWVALGTAVLVLYGLMMYRSTRVYLAIATAIDGTFSTGKAAFAACLTATRGRFWRTFGNYLLFVLCILPLMLISIGANLATDGMSPTENGMAMSLTDFAIYNVGQLPFALIMPLTGIFSFLLYMTYKKEGIAK